MKIKCCSLSLTDLSDVSQGLTPHQLPGDLAHLLAEDHRGHKVANGLCLPLVPGESGQIKTQPAAHLLNVEETHTAAIPDDDRRGASVPDPCPVNGADLAQMTPMGITS